MNFIYKITAAIMTVIISLTGVNAEPETPENELKIAVFGKEPNGFDKVVEEAESRLAESGAGEYELNFEFYSDDDADNKYGDEMYVKLLAGEEYDIVYDSTGRNFNALKDMEIYAPLEKYILDTDDYPYLRDMYPEDVWSVQKNSYGHIFGIPHFKSYGGTAQCVYYRKDFAEEWGMGELTDMADFREYMDNCIKYKNMTPYSIQDSSGALALLPEDEALLLDNHIVKYSDGRVIAYILLNDDNSGVKDVVMFDEPEDAFAEFPEAYRGGAGLEMSRWLECAGWSKYFDNDKDRDVKPKEMFTKGETAAYTAGYSEYYSLGSELKKNEPDGEVGRLFINPPDVSPRTGLVTRMSFSDFSCIPITSHKIEKSLKFLNWLASDTENMNLFAYGIEGVHWEYTGENEYRKIKDTEDYSLNGCNFTNYTGNLMFASGTAEELKIRDGYAADYGNYRLSPIAGFVFDTSKVSGETAKVNNTITDDMRRDIINGREKNPEEKIAECFKRAERAQKKIKTALREQVEYYIENGKNMNEK